MAEAAAAVKRLGEIDRAKVRATFERRFTVERMARDYLAIYQGKPERVARAPAMHLPARATAAVG